MAEEIITAAQEAEEPAEQSEQELSELLKVRRDKLDQLKAQGNDPFVITTCGKNIDAAEIVERFEELEEQLQAFVTLFDDEWKKARKKIRKDILWTIENSDKKKK